MTLILFAGQSNAVGFGNTGPAPYAPTPRVQIWTDVNHNGAWDIGDNFAMMVPAGAWGPEVQFANDWLAENPTGTLWIGKVAKGETDLAEDWAPGGVMYDKAQTVAIHMQANQGVHGIDALMWMQGESDAFDFGAASAYHDRLDTFVDHAIGWGVQEVIMGRIADAQPYASEVRYAQWLVDQEREDVTSFRTLGFEMQGDGVHYSAAGHVALGHAFWEAWT